MNNELIFLGGEDFDFLWERLESKILFYREDGNL